MNSLTNRFFIADFFLECYSQCEFHIGIPYSEPVLYCKWNFIVQTSPVSS